MIDYLTIVVHIFASGILMSFSDETLLPRLENLNTSFREPPFTVEMSSFLLNPMYSILSALTQKPMPSTACSRLSRDSAWVGVIYSASIIVCADYRLLLGIFKNLKPFSYLRSINFWSAKSRQIIYIYIYIYVTRLVDPL